MGEVINARTLLNQMISKIRPDMIDLIFANADKFSGSLVELLLNNEATAIYHLDPDNLYHLGNPFVLHESTFIKPVLLGCNYHKGHSEGDYKIIIQNIREKKGPWVLFRPPGSDEFTFYLQSIISPRIKAKYEEDVSNPLKIKQIFLHRGEPLQIFEEFKKEGFTFIDSEMSEEKFDYLNQLSLSNIKGLRIYE